MLHWQLWTSVADLGTPAVTSLLGNEGVHAHCCDKQHKQYSAAIRVGISMFTPGTGGNASSTRGTLPCVAPAEHKSPHQAAHDMQLS